MACKPRLSMCDFEDSSRMVLQALSVSFPRAIASFSRNPDFKKLGISKGPGKKDGQHREYNVVSMGIRPHVAWMINGD